MNSSATSGKLPVQPRRLLLDLPTDVLAHLLGRFAPWSARATCRTFHSLIEAGATTLRLSSQYGVRLCRATRALRAMPTAAAMLARLPRLQHLSCQCTGDVRLKFLLLPGLTSFALGSDDATVYPNMFGMWRAGMALNVVDLTGLQECTALRTLRLTSCSLPWPLSPLTLCSSLTALDLRGSMPQLHTSAADLGPHQTLTSLDLSHLLGPICLNALSSYTTLYTLSLASYQWLYKLDALVNTPCLTALNISRCANVADLTPIGRATGLTSLDLSHCKHVASVAPLAACLALQTLDVSGCPRIATVAPLCACSSLTHLNMSRLYRAGHAASLGPLCLCGVLTHLDVSCCHLVSLRCLTHCASLTALNLYRTGLLLEAAGAVAHLGLRSVTISSVKQVEVRRALRAAFPLARIVEQALWC